MIRLCLVFLVIGVIAALVLALGIVRTDVLRNLALGFGFLFVVCLILGLFMVDNLAA